MKLHSDEAGGDGACLTDAQMVVQVQGKAGQGKANRRGCGARVGPGVLGLPAATWLALEHFKVAAVVQRVQQCNAV